MTLVPVYPTTKQYTPRMNAEQIHALLKARQSSQAPEVARGLEIQRAYNGELVVPLPELDASERSAVANLIQSAIDQTGMRVASVMPSMVWPSLRVGIKASEKKARVRDDVVTGWWDDARMNLKLRRRARYLLAYGHSPVFVRPGESGLGVWHIRDPLTAYPGTGSDPDEIVPPDCVFTFKRSRAWLTSNYPEQMNRLSKHEGTQSFEVIEYSDANECVLFVCGDKPTEAGYHNTGYDGSSAYEILHAYPNRTEMPLVVNPARITLGDRRMGAYDGMIGMMQLQAKVMALSVIGMQRGIFPETWLVSAQNSQAKIVRHADPMRGVIGLATGGVLDQVRQDASPMAGVMVDRLAGEQRVEGSVPSEYSGISGPNVRTGRRGEQVIAAAVDFFIQEAQVLFEQSLEAENKIAVAVAKAYSGDRTFSMYVKGRGNVTYTPDRDFETDQHEVRYAYAGADANGLEIRIGQKLGMETISRKTAMELDPLVRDVEAEMDRIDYEALKRAFWSNVQSMAADPNSPLTPMDIARLAQLVVSDKAEPWDALEQVQKEAQERQAALAQAEAAAVPEQMPGIEGPASMRPEGAMPSIAAPDEGIGNLASLLTRMRRPQMSLPSEQGASLPAGPA